ncbi:DUF3768 domain-containing protein [Litoreibacter roseus]|uniref:DUF3768 domain-containing protein n=1 Tax=Litoreibacter roseus TaxID=2601869 RepID=A0A6N6JM85_9RHOB|nr:DUF3768 domain-containing protein [Litoreibacter roseus]GFE67097.1 hypothetical protein KIN_41710 [Litoreibacter roseus]
MTTDEITIDNTPDLSSAETAKLVAEQNDRFRKASVGVATEGPIPPGRVMMTRGIAEQSDTFKEKLFAAIGAYGTFNEDSDPYGWHEMGVMEIDGVTVWFKLDLYDENYEYGSADPTDPQFTRRVMTLLLPSEY